MAIDLAVQIVNYGTRPYLDACLRSILDDLGGGTLRTRVLVLDNDSGDDLSELQRSLAGAVEFRYSETNRGFGAGHNLLAAEADCEFLCVVNPDITLTRPGVFARLLANFADDRVAVAGPMLVLPSGAPQPWDHGELSGLRARIANGAGHAHWRARSERAPVAWVSGAFMLVRRASFDAAGGFDERYFLYKEEEDLCLRIRRAGGVVVYDPAVCVTHVGSVVASKDEHLDASLEHYMAKNFPGRRRRALELLYRRVSSRL